MAQIFRAVFGMMVLLAHASGSAQPTQPSTSVRAQEATGAWLAKPGGMPDKRGQLSVTTRPEVAPIKSNEPLEQFLQRNRIATDAATVEAVRKLNPGLGTAAPAADMHLYIPKPTANQDVPKDLVLQLRHDEYALHQIRQDQADLDRIKLKSGSRADPIFAPPGLKARHGKVLDDMKATLALLSAAAPSMDARDLAIINFQIDEIRRAADPDVQAPVGTSKVFTQTQIISLEKKAQPLRAVMDASPTPHPLPAPSAVPPKAYPSPALPAAGASAAPGRDVSKYHRRVRVIVNSSNAAAPPPLRVYLLPAAIVENPGAYTVDVVRSMLRGQTFLNLTTPSEQQLLFGEYAIWLGPDNAYETMLEKLRQGLLSGTRPLFIGPGLPAIVDLFFSVP